MSDWDFLHEMHDRGHSAEEIALAAGVGYAPWEEECLSKEWIDAELLDQPPEAADAVQPREQFRSREGFPYSVLEQAAIFEDLVDCAKRHFRNPHLSFPFGSTRLNPGRRRASIACRMFGVTLPSPV